MTTQSINSTDNYLMNDLLQKKELARLDLGGNLSILLDDLNKSNQSINEFTQIADPLLANKQQYENFLEKIRHLQDNSMKMSSLIKLGFSW